MASVIGRLHIFIHVFIEILLAASFIGLCLVLFFFVVSSFDSEELCLLCRLMALKRLCYFIKLVSGNL